MGASGVWAKVCGQSGGKRNVKQQNWCPEGGGGGRLRSKECKKRKRVGETSSRQDVTQINGVVTGRKGPRWCSKMHDRSPTVLSSPTLAATEIFSPEGPGTGERRGGVRTSVELQKFGEGGYRTTSQKNITKKVGGKKRKKGKGRGKVDGPETTKGKRPTHEKKRKGKGA